MIIKGTSRQVISKLLELLVPQQALGVLAVQALAAAKRDGETIVDNDCLESFTQVKITHHGNNVFTLETICQNVNTLAH